jgi:hypothetical protein
MAFVFISLPAALAPASAQAAPTSKIWMIEQSHDVLITITPSPANR